ncbi:MAG: RNA-binding protein [Bacteroidota bacterium]
MNIFIAKLSNRTKGEDLRTLFEEYGEVLSAKVIFDRETGKSKRFGFVEMPNDDEGQNAINALNDSEFQNSTIVVKVANPKS